MSKDKENAAPQGMRVFALNLEELEQSTHAQCTRVWDMLEAGEDPISMIAEAVEEYTTTDPRESAALAAKYANAMLHLAAATHGLSHTPTTPTTPVAESGTDEASTLPKSARKVMDSLIAQIRERVAHTMMFSGRAMVEGTINRTVNRVHDAIHRGVGRDALIDAGHQAIAESGVSMPDLQYAVAHLTVRLASALCLGEDLYHKDTAKDDTTAESGE